MWSHRTGDARAEFMPHGRGRVLVSSQVFLDQLHQEAKVTNATRLDGISH